MQAFKVEGLKKNMTIWVQSSIFFKVNPVSMCARRGVFSKWDIQQFFLSVGMLSISFESLAYGSFVECLVKSVAALLSYDISCQFFFIYITENKCKI